MILPSIMLSISAARSDSVSTCLRHLTNVRAVAVSAYDVANDKHGNNSISCNFSLTASEVADDLRAILDTTNKHDCNSLVLVSSIPLSVKLRVGSTRRLYKQDICRQQVRIRRFIGRNREAFSVDQLDLLGWRGAFLGGDKILVNTIREGRGRPHLKLVAIGPI